MDTRTHTMNDLFSQLGLDSDEDSIAAFVAKHGPLERDMPLYRAPFWTPAQRNFLKEEIIEDADWSCVIDELNARLH